MGLERQGDRVAGSAAHGGAFYDRRDVFERYRTRRSGSSQFVMEEPAVLGELGSAQGLRVVDLGCGDAALGRALLKAGCERYVGVDASRRMVQAARQTLGGTRGEVVHGEIEAFSAPPDTFDLIVSRLALHYIEHVEPVLAAARACLSPGGRVIVTVLHPVITSHEPRASTEDLRTSWLVDDYFVTGPREERWLGETVVWHHRTIEQYVSALQRAGFALTALRECAPPRERFDDEAEFSRRRRIPMFLLLAGARA